MNDFFPVIAIFALLLPVFYLLWVNGYLAINAKRAVLYVGNGGKNFSGATVKGCTGYVKRVFKMKNSGTYQFNLELVEDCGEIIVILQDKLKNDIAIFDSQRTEKSLYMEGNEIYYLKFTYKKASGTVKLSWQSL